MAAQRGTGLVDEQVRQLRSELEAGRRPRVRVSGTQFPAVTTGTVLRVGDPKTDGGDFITVRVKVGGVTDELAFSPKELSAGRGRTAPPATARTKPAPRPRTRAAVKSPEAPPVEAAPARPPARANTARSQRRATPPPTVTLTIASIGSSWSITAQRGARVVVKKAPVTPGVVEAVAALLDQPEVDDAVAAVNDAARGEAEARAQKLRAELAEVEAVLVSHRRP